MVKKSKIFILVKWLILLILFDMELHIKGFNSIFKDYSKKYKLVNINNQKPYNNKILSEIEQLFVILDIACAWYPRKADCIHKTFLGYRTLRREYGVPVDMVIGLRKFPFEAHAWLQLNNQNFFNDFEETMKYKIIMKSADYIEGDQ